MVTLTGKTRYRLYKPFFGTHKLVLQVEKRFDWHVPGSGKVFKSDCRWSDATIEDLQELNNGNGSRTKSQG